MKKQTLMPVVQVTFLDHSASLEGGQGPVSIVAIGLLVDDTPDGYQLAHWYRLDEQDNDQLVSFILKGPGTKIKTLGHVVVDTIK